MMILLVLNVLSIFICYYVAKSKGAKASFWALMGAVFGLFAVPFVFFSKPREKLRE